MGSNQVELAEGYLELEAKLNEYRSKGDKYNEQLTKAKMDGIVFCYNTYTAAHWDTFDHLLEQYDDYMARGYGRDWRNQKQEG